jgi:hypothetical protein
MSRAWGTSRAVRSGRRGEATPFVAGGLRYASVAEGEGRAYLERATGRE